jgi:hypothetical protein
LKSIPNINLPPLAICQVEAAVDSSFPIVLRQSKTCKQKQRTCIFVDCLLLNNRNNAIDGNATIIALASDFEVPILSPKSGPTAEGVCTSGEARLMG